ncbi:MAG: hypothetical protein OXU66_05880 [Gammaproteobacteria bacterium]|nr:hypothetical protein [Gammaproteobacteria bacterium]MDD9958454.1 hypothetical protein [Gammaproteobacteria bacterium]
MDSSFTLSPQISLFDEAWFSSGEIQSAREGGRYPCGLLLAQTDCNQQWWSARTQTKGSRFSEVSDGLSVFPFTQLDNASPRGYLLFFLQARARVFRPWPGKG